MNITQKIKSCHQEIKNINFLKFILTTLKIVSMYGCVGFILAFIIRSFFFI